MPCCPICLEEKDDGDFAEATCFHGFCWPCFAEWVESCEACKPQRIPACPTCAAEIVPSDIVGLLGRPFQKRATTVAEIEAVSDDEFFQTWLQENHAVQCPGCKIWATLIDGCNHVVCGWCDRSFCFGCGKPESKCLCDNVDDAFYMYNYYYNSDVGHLGCACSGGDDASGLMETVRDGTKNARGGKSSLRWKGNTKSNKRTNKGTAKQKEEEGKPRHGSRKRNARKKTKRRVVAQGLALTS